MGDPFFDTVLCLVAAIVGWLIVGGVAKWLAGAKARGVVSALRLASAVLTTAVAFRVVAHHDSAWFAQLGDYYHPVLTTLSLVGLAAALYYQRLELREAQRQSAFARHRLEEEVKSHRLSDASFVFIDELRLFGGEYRLSVVCGGTAIAMNVRVRLALLGDERDAVAISRAVMLPGEKMERTIKWTTDDIIHKNVTVWIRWLNVHSMELSYRAQMTAAGQGFWTAPEQIVGFIAAAGHNQDFVSPV